MPIKSLTYNKELMSYTQKLSKIEIEQMMQNYKKINNNDLEHIPRGTFIRYFVKQDNGKYLFRVGGFLYNKDPFKEGWIRLSANGVKWSVQLDTALLYIEKTTDEIIDSYNQTINKQQILMNKLMEKRLKNILTKENPPELKNYYLLSDYTISKLLKQATIYAYNIKTKQIEQYDFDSCVIYKNKVVLVIVNDEENNTIGLNPQYYWFYKSSIKEKLTNDQIKRIGLLS